MPNVPPMANIPQFSGLVRAASDGGSCPLNTGESVSLQDVQGLTRGERSEIIQMAASSEMGFNAQPGLIGADMNRVGDFALFRYTAGGRNLLLLLQRDGGKWKVVEPAMPL